jgi:hypothetical protein
MSQYFKPTNQQSQHSYEGTAETKTIHFQQLNAHPNLNQSAPRYMSDTVLSSTLDCLVTG